MSKILIVDDERDTAATLESLVRILLPGVETFVAVGGHAAIEWALLHRPDAIVVDIEMPMFDGLEVAAWIRDSMGASAPLLIGISGNVFKLEHGLEAGLFDHALRKPISIDELIALLPAAGSPPPEASPLH